LESPQIHQRKSFAGIKHQVTNHLKGRMEQIVKINRLTEYPSYLDSLGHHQLASLVEN
jgi:hypothetical protein